MRSFTCNKPVVANCVRDDWSPQSLLPGPYQLAGFVAFQGEIDVARRRVQAAKACSTYYYREEPLRQTEPWFLPKNLMKESCTMASGYRTGECGYS